MLTQHRHLPIAGHIDLHRHYGNIVVGQCPLVGIINIGFIVIETAGQTKAITTILDLLAAILLAPYTPALAAHAHTLDFIERNIGHIYIKAKRLATSCIHLKCRTDNLSAIIGRGLEIGIKIVVTDNPTEGQP